MNKKCDSMMELYLSLDKHSSRPFSLNMHLLTCKKCRAEIRSMTLADKACMHPLSNPESIGLKSSILKVMRKIDPDFEKKQQHNPITLAVWILGFIVMITGVLCFGIFKPQTISGNFAILSYVLIGFAVVGFSILFIHANINFLITLIEKKQNRKTDKKKKTSDEKKIFRNIK